MEVTVAQVFELERGKAGTWLVPPPSRVLTPHRNRAGAAQVKPVAVAVVHFTASPWSARHVHHLGSDPARQRRWLSGQGAKSSTHFDVLRDGAVLQAAPLEDRTWHAGGSTWVDPRGRKVAYVNRESIGLDLDNVGRLYETLDGPVDSYEWAAMHTAPGESRPDFGRLSLRRPRAGAVFRGPSWRDRQGRLWEAYTGAALRTFLKLARRLADLLPQLRDPARWTGHEHIRATKSDPGPAFPWPWLYAAVSAGLSDEQVDTIDWHAVPGVLEVSHG